MKTTSKVLLALGIIAVIVAAGLYFLLANLDRIVAAAIEKYGSEATATKVRVSSVRINLRGGEGAIRGLSIGNPAGFATSNALQLETIAVAVDTGSVTRDPVVIDKVTISEPRITYEINTAGLSNINVIRKHLEGKRDKAPPGKKSADGGGKKIVIRSLVVEKGEISIQVAALSGKPLTASLPRIELRDLGGKGGDSPGDIASQILGPLMDQVALAASRTGIGQYLGKEAGEIRKALEEKAQEKLGIPAEDAAKGAEEAVKKLFGK